MPVSE